MRLTRPTKRQFVRLMAVSFAVFLLTTCCAAQNQPTTGQGQTQAARPAASSGSQNAAALEFFDQPEFVVAGVTDAMGQGGHGSDRMVQATEALTKEMGSLDRHSTVATTELAEQESSLRDALRQEPENALKNFRLGDLLVKLGRNQEALPYLQKAHALKPDYATDYALAIAYGGSGDWQQARSGAQSLLASRDDAGLHHLLAQADEQLGDPLAAEHEYQRSTQLDPSESNLFDWGVELLEHRAVEPAIDVFKLGSDMYPHSVRMLMGLGVSWSARGYYEQAAHSLCQASDIDPLAEAPYIFLGKMEGAGSAGADCALERLKRFARLQPTNALSNYYFAVSLWKSRKDDNDLETTSAVESLLQTAIRLDPSLAVAYLQLGILYAHRADLTRAAAAYSKAIDLDPALDESHYRLAQVYFKTGEDKKARAEVQVYDRLSQQTAGQEELQRKKLKQFVYTLRSQPPTPGK